MRKPIFILIVLSTCWIACGSTKKGGPSSSGPSHAMDLPFSAVVEFNGGASGGGPLLAVDGLSSQTEAIEFREGGASLDMVKKIPGRTSYANLLLQREFRDTSWWDWRQQVISGMPQPRSGALIFLQPDGREVVRWNFFGAWAARYSLKLRHSTLVEELEIAIERGELQKKSGP